MTIKTLKHIIHPCYGITLTETARNTIISALGVLVNAGNIQLKTSGDVVVATLTFSATAFGSAASGVITANAITDDTNAVGGTVAKAIFRNSSNVEMFRGTVTVDSGGGDLEGPSVVIVAAETVSIDSLTLTQPAS